MRTKKLSLFDDMAIARIQVQKSDPMSWTPTHAEWIRILRSYLRMTQAELAKRAQITQPHLAGIEAGRIDPKISTLKHIYGGLNCDLVVEPRAQKPIKEILRGRARSVALKRLKQAMGTMALENQAPDKEAFLNLLEKRTDEILNDPRERIWATKDDE